MNSQTVDQHAASPRRAFFTLGLVLLALVIAYIAVKEDDTKPQHQFVDSTVLPDDIKQEKLK